MLKFAILLNPVYVTLFWTISLFLAMKPGQRPVRNLFNFMLAAFVLYTSHALYFSGYLLEYSYIDGLYLFCSLSVYPLFYFYVRDLATGSGVRPVQYFHLLIPFLFAAMQYILYSGLDRPARLEYLISTMEHHPSPGGTWYWLYTNSRLARLVFAVQVIVYISLSLRLLNRHREQVRDMFSNEDRYGLGWVRLITFFMILMAITSFALALAGRQPFTGNEHLLLIPSVIISTLLFTIGFIGNIQLQKTEPITPVIEREENFHSHIIPDGVLRKKFDEFFTKSKPYLDKDLKIWDISRELGSNRTYISRVINDEYGMNFTSFVNHYRIDEAKRLINEDSKGSLTYETIAELSGFGSINSFNRAFKEFESMTPGRYREKLRRSGSNTTL